MRLKLQVVFYEDLTCLRTLMAKRYKPPLSDHQDWGHSSKWVLTIGVCPSYKTTLCAFQEPEVHKVLICEMKSLVLWVEAAGRSPISDDRCACAVSVRMHPLPLTGQNICTHHAHLSPCTLPVYIYLPTLYTSIHIYKSIQLHCSFSCTITDSCLHQRAAPLPRHKTPTLTSYSIHCCLDTRLYIWLTHHHKIHKSTCIKYADIHTHHTDFTDALFVYISLSIISL